MFRIQNYKQQNYCITLLRKAKKECSSILSETCVTGSKTFLQPFKASLLNKKVNSPKITLVEENKITNNEEKYCRNLQYIFFTNIVSNLKITAYQDTDFAVGNDSVFGDDPTTFILEIKKCHQSIKVIKKFYHENNGFNFEAIKRDIFLISVHLDIFKTS